MKKQALVIGLGEFGMSVARALASRDVEVLAIDRNTHRVRLAASFTAEALTFDATDETSLARAAPAKRDLSVCTIGQESKEASIICTALLRQMGAPRVIARANDELHARILSLVGAHEVVNPEREFGEQFATRLVYENVVGELPLGHDLVITQLQVPAAFVGRCLKELDLPRKHGITVVAMFEEAHRPSVALPRPDKPLREGELMLVVSKPGAVARMLERL